MRPYDVVLLGATGFTGQLVAEELAREPGRLRWAVAGRDAHKLRDIKAGLVGISPDNGGVGTLLADVTDPASLRELARQARVLVTTVGPYAERGIGVVEAAVEEGAHYLDITGEPGFVSESRARFDELARSKGLKIVHCCGFDSIPADLGALFTVSQLPAGVPKQVRGYMKLKASFSGGTWASAIGGMANLAERSRHREGAGGGSSTGSSKSSSTRPLLHRPPEGVRGVAIPMPVIDPVLVRRSARELPDRYGSEFDYRQFLVLRSLSRAARLVAGVGAVAAAARFGPTRRWLLSRRPSGEGPSAEEREKSFFQITFVGKAPGLEVRTRVSGGDPGYTETSRMLSRCALLLAEKDKDLPARYGVLTPAVAFGDLGIEAMREAGLSFEVLPA
jgi:short subunit dehydrogenase-like uncharacterized protein